MRKFLHQLLLTCCLASPLPILADTSPAPVNGPSPTRGTGMPSTPMTDSELQ